MYIIKHKTRRKQGGIKRINEPFYFNVNGTWDTDNLEDAVEVAFEAWNEQLRTAKPAETIWEAYA